MKLDLWELAKSAEKRHTELTITERLPHFLSEPCDVSVVYQVKIVDDFYLIQIETSGKLDVHCERCAEMFQVDYRNSQELAITENDVRAQVLSRYYDSIAASNGSVDLEDLIIDELHLYAPRVHKNIEDCDKTLGEYLK